MTSVKSWSQGSLCMESPIQEGKSTQTHSPPQRLSTVQAKTREKKKAEPLPHNVQFSAQKSRFLACATTTTVQTQEGEFVQ